MKPFKILSAILSAVLTVCPICTNSPAGKISPAQINSFALDSSEIKNIADSVVAFVNKERESAGVSPLKALPTLYLVAQARAVECSNVFSHERPDGSPLITIFDGSGLSFMSYAENIAYNASSDPENVVKQWLTSQGHRENMLSGSYDHIGVGVCEKDGYYYWCQIFTGSTSPTDGEYTPEIEQSPDFSNGDVNGDGHTDASDASFILGVYSMLSTGQSPNLPEKQFNACDVNGNGLTDASDASEILSYYAYLSTGGTYNLSLFLQL